MSTVWNFAYGSNLSPQRVRARGIVPLRWEPARLEGWQLCFDLVALPPMEPGFATLREARTRPASVHGVCIAMRQEDFERLVRSEFASRKRNAYGYRVTPVEVETYAGARLEAMTLVAAPSACLLGTLPSERYMTLIERGAAESGLDPDYQGFLRHHPRHRPGGLSPLVHRAVRALSWPLRQPGRWALRLGEPRVAAFVARKLGRGMARSMARMPEALRGRTVRVEGYDIESLRERWPSYMP